METSEEKKKYTQIKKICVKKTPNTLPKKRKKQLQPLHNDFSSTNNVTQTPSCEQAGNWGPPHCPADPLGRTIFSKYLSPGGGQAGGHEGCTSARGRPIK